MRIGHGHPRECTEEMLGAYSAGRLIAALCGCFSRTGDMAQGTRLAGATTRPRQRKPSAYHRGCSGPCL